MRVYSILVPDPESEWIVVLLFETARERGWGQVRLARFLNEHADIPEQFKPFQQHTVGYWLEQEIYCGTLDWPKIATDIIDDTRVTEAVPAEEQLRITDFCQPLISQELFDVVNRVRKERGNAIKAARQNKAPEAKLLKAPAPGLALKYMLTGLTRCGHCQRSMTPCSSSVYTTKGGQERRYVSYGCPGNRDGICPNHRRIPEEWLRKAVIDNLRRRLFPAS